jgi:hypothetical protein
LPDQDRVVRVWPRLPNLPERCGAGRLPRMIANGTVVLEGAARQPIQDDPLGRPTIRAGQSFDSVHLSSCRWTGPDVCGHLHRLGKCNGLVRPARFELATFGFGGQRSIQLSYGRARGVCSLQFAVRSLVCGPWSAVPRFAVHGVAFDSRFTAKRQTANCKRPPSTELVRPEGFEPPAYGFEARRSIQLSYGRAREPIEFITTSTISGRPASGPAASR